MLEHPRRSPSRSRSHPAQHGPQHVRAGASAACCCPQALAGKGGAGGGCLAPSRWGLLPRLHVCRHAPTPASWQNAWEIFSEGFLPWLKVQDGGAAVRPW